MKIQKDIITETIKAIKKSHTPNLQYIFTKGKMGWMTNGQIALRFPKEDFSGPVAECKDEKATFEIDTFARSEVGCPDIEKSIPHGTKEIKRTNKLRDISASYSKRLEVARWYVGDDFKILLSEKYVDLANLYNFASVKGINKKRAVKFISDNDDYLFLIMPIDPAKLNK